MSKEVNSNCQMNFTKYHEEIKIKNVFLKHRTDTNQKNYITQRNLSKNLLKNTKKSYFENLHTKKINDNGSFWRTVLPLFTQNSSKGEKINLIDDSETTCSDEELCETFNQFFSNVVPTLNIYQNLSLFRWQGTVLILLCL